MHGDMSMRRRGGATTAPKAGGFVPASVQASFKKFDVYPKLQEDFRVKTQSGAAGVFDAYRPGSIHRLTHWHRRSVPHIGRTHLPPRDLGVRGVHDHQREGPRHR